MEAMNYGLIAVFVIAVPVLIFMLCREFFNWYFKITIREQLTRFQWEENRKTNELLKEILKELKDSKDV